jgi:hypothetical protein
MMRRISGALFVALGVLAASGPFAVQDFFAGKQIRIIGGTGEGGGE